MALAFFLLPPKPITPPLSFSSSASSFLLPNTISIKSKRTTRTKNPPPLTVTSSSKIKITRCPSLDRHASAHNRLRFVRKLTTLLLSKPRHFLPLRVLSRCRRYLSLPPRRSILSMIHRYPSIFHLSHRPSFSLFYPHQEALCVSLTTAALSLFTHQSHLRSQISASLASKLQSLLMLCTHTPSRLLLSKLAHIAPDLGLPPNFRSRLCNSHPHRFRTVPTSYGRALELVSCEPLLPSILPPLQPPHVRSTRPIIDRPPKFGFTQLNLRKGLNLRRRHLDSLIRFRELPEVNPYLLRSLDEGMSEDEKEKRACAVVREVLGMTVEKRTLVDHLTHFRKELGLPNKLRAMLVRHPEMFYVSVKGLRDSVFLVEAYDDRGKLVVEDELLSARVRLEELVSEGKRMRRERRRGIGVNIGSGDETEEDEEEVGDDDDDDDDDGFGDLFKSGIGDDWDQFVDGECRDEDDKDERKESLRYWSLKEDVESSASGGGGGGGGGRLVW